MWGVFGEQYVLFAILWARKGGEALDYWSGLVWTVQNLDQSRAPRLMVGLSLRDTREGCVEQKTAGLSGRSNRRGNGAR